jgi:2-polyprenyl-6-hydroxyphenyl methylase / 3-demethylubiquinone-9 3-methyltransferase
MTKASIATNRKLTINPNEAAHFGALAADWWDPKGSSAMLHKLNPVRLSFIRRMINAHFGGDERSLKPLAGKTTLDVGCGAGLLCEPLARMGAAVTGVDAAPENIAAAAAHAAQSGLAIEYRAGELSAQNLGMFDLVTSMEVIEHVTDPAAFVAALVTHLKLDGLLIMSTPNRTAASKLLLVEAAERLGQVPRGTHDWDQFLVPDELTELLVDAGLEVTAMEGITFSPLKGLHLSENKALNYILAARHSGSV